MKRIRARRLAGPVVVLAVLQHGPAHAGELGEPAGASPAKASLEAGDSFSCKLVWILYRLKEVTLFGVQMLAWAAADDNAPSRASLEKEGKLAVEELLSLREKPCISLSEQTELQQIAAACQVYIRILEDKALDEGQARRRLQASRVDIVQQIIRPLEDRTSRLSNQIGEHVMHLEPHAPPQGPERLSYRAYLAVSLLGAESSLPNDRASLGFELAAQWNVIEFVGVLGGVQSVPLELSGMTGAPEGSKLSWHATNIHLGMVATPLSADVPVSFQVGGGLGLALSKLRYVAPALEPGGGPAEDGVRHKQNLFLFLRADLGVAPPRSFLEPIASLAYSRLFNDLKYQTGDMEGSVGNSVWSFSLGLRLRL